MFKITTAREEPNIYSFVRFDIIMTKSCHFLVTWCRDIS
jgi:hypothetical protein